MRRTVLAMAMVVAAHGAQAADYPEDLPILRGSVRDGVIPRWQGVYIGGQAGTGSSDMNFSNATMPVLTLSASPIMIISEAYRSKRLFIPLLIGNLLTYSFIAYTMATKTDKDPNEKRTEQILYSPIPSSFTLLDSTKLQIFKAKTEISYDKDDKVLNTNYPLEIQFKKEITNLLKLIRFPFVINGH